MNGDYDPVDSPAVRRGSWFRPLIIPLVAFLLGLGAMGYILARWDAAARSADSAAACASRRCSASLHARPRP